MRFFYCLILLSCIFVKYSLAINNNNYIPCTSYCSPIKLSFSESSKLPDDCQPNDHAVHIYENALLCTVEYSIDYATGFVNIRFAGTNDTSMINNKYSGEYLIQDINLNIIHYGNREFTTIRRYGCSSVKDCAREFYLNTIAELVKDGLLELRIIKQKLNEKNTVFGNTAKRRCIEKLADGSSRHEPCKDGLCYSDYQNYTSAAEQGETIQKCDKDNQQLFVNSSIEYHSPPQNQKDREILKYRCNKHVCNRDEMIRIIQGIITKYTRWNPTLTRNDIMINTKTVTQSSVSQTVSSSIVVLVLMLIRLFI